MSPSLPTLRVVSPDHETQKGGDPHTGSVAARPLVFWFRGGDILFRDETGAIRPVNVITVRATRANLWNMAREARGRNRTRLSTIYAEATDAIEDLMRWRGVKPRRSAMAILLGEEPGVVA